MFRFTLRDLMLVIVIVALTVGWLLDNRQNRILNDQYRNQILKANMSAMRSDGLVQLLLAREQQRNEQPFKLPFQPGQWTVEEIKEAVAKGEQDAASREARMKLNRHPIPGNVHLD